MFIVLVSLGLHDAYIQKPFSTHSFIQNILLIWALDGHYPDINEACSLMGEADNTHMCTCTHTSDKYDEGI